MIKLLIFDFYGVLFNTQDCQIDDELLNYIKKLSSKYKIVLLSNIHKSTFDRIIAKKPGARELFEVIATSHEIGYAKPSKQAYTFVCEALQIEPKRCLMIDDSPINCRGAEEAGLSAVLYSGVADLKIKIDKINN